MEHKDSRLIFCSDVHLCHLNWYGPTSEQRLDDLILRLNEHYDKTPYERIVFLGDYSLNHWAWSAKDSWLTPGISNAARFRHEYTSRLIAPCYMLPGNHEQFGEEAWHRMSFIVS